MSKTTIYDIASELNITPSTVSRALSNHPRISARTKKAVREVATRLNYRQNSIAAALRSGKTNMLGIVVPTTDRSFFSSVIRSIEQVATASEYNVMITQSNDQEKMERSNIEALLRAQVDGVIASISRETSDYSHFRKLTDNGIPLVLFDRVADLNHTSIVRIDDYRGAYEATAHLIAQGCSRIAHFAGQQKLDIYQQRFRGYKDALQDHRIAFDEALLHYSNVKIEDGRAGMNTLLRLKSPPDAVFAASDYAAIGAMQVLKEKGKRIPEDVALIGFMNETFTSFVDPGLTTVDQLSKKMGEIAASTFLEQVECPDEFVSKKIILSPKLIVRGSSLKADSSSMESNS
ncbi:MAG: LacI family DNA-binding transcriptional regulator [Phaeodactylibacter xiamenensis]|uniref:LacI family transcriptional regulator n=1 Tax=Phaeodactylibacter xiamenensis TaxID=1524460 RepID=A0A098S4L9_9BACT|nr:LacI family DNA-binding transcriptional regulator [Phaeodactylibacter xiamenensis]KGE86971.1 LacI family transcriptional regulator [Phaeodactylibacter xiamenensis]MCR9050578.1 LacI family transcriptional regulator [bacterium]